MQKGQNMDTISLLIDDVAKRFDSLPALSQPGPGDTLTTLTYAMLQERSDQFAGYLQQQQYSKGERLMIWSASRIDWLIAFLGAMRVGMVVVPLDVNTREDFLQRLIETTEAKFLITTQKQYDSLQKLALPFI